MSDPERLHISDWFGAGVALVLALAGFLYTWIRGRRVAMRDRFDKIDKEMSEMKVQMAKYDEQLAVGENNMENISKNLDKLQECTNQQTKLLHDILLKMSR